jgi:glycosyltransferase involved in cell wall biosynthesis
MGAAVVRTVRGSFLAPLYVDELRPDTGWPYFMSRALCEAGVLLERPEPAPSPGVLRTLSGRVANQLLGRQSALRTKRFAVETADRLALHMARTQPEIIVSADSIPVSYLECKAPIVLWLDATFDLLTRLYPGYAALRGDRLREGRELESAALRKVRLAIFSSRWAAESAVNHYGVDRSRVAVVPWGANLESSPKPNEVQRAIDARPADSCRLVLVAREWGRKGGDTAIAIATELNRRGMRAELTVVGCGPKRASGLPDYVRLLGYLNKDIVAERRQFERAVAEAHFLVLPTRADCTPLAIHEAAAFGVPTLASRVGGIPESIVANVTGQTFPQDASPGAYADYALRVLSERSAYRHMALTSAAEYAKRLNWQQSATTVAELLVDVLDR